jgi:hypothetical protein
LPNILEGQISSFADAENRRAFLEQHLRSESPWGKIFEAIAGGLDENNLRKPHGLWKDIDEDLRELLGVDV